MRKSTLIGCFIGLLGLTLNAQIPQPSSTTLNGTNKIVVPKNSSSSFEDLLVRYNNQGKWSGSVSDHFTLEEQQKLRSYFKTQQSNKSLNVVKQQVYNSFEGEGQIIASPEKRVSNQTFFMAPQNLGTRGSQSAYCIPEGINSDRYIDNFSTTGGSENISNIGSGFSADGYGDFYDTDSIAQEQDGTVEFSVDIMGEISGFRIWIDWNQDGVFDVAEEVAYSSTGYDVTHTGTITVPTDALEGDTRMRIVSHWLSTTGDVDPCETGFNYGEFEDYKFTVSSGGGGSGPLTTFYGIDNYTQDLIGFGVATPEETEVFGASPITLAFEAAGAIDPANPTMGYVLDSDGQFYSIDVESGFYTS
ncbi:MAG: GEVED domain-containing protein [Aequorivita sp.]